MNKPLLDKLVVYGAGLIGGSFALALKRAKAVRRVVGVGRSRKTLQQALRLRVIDEIAGGDAQALRDADLVLLAMPVAQTAPVLARIAPHLGPRTVVTDAGSTKQDVVSHAARFLGPHLSRFVPAHPIAGAEKTGPQAAKADLYRDRNVVIVPQPQTSAAALRLVKRAWRLCGARVSEMTADAHDRMFAAVSHLPHVLAFALVDEIAQRRDAATLFRYTAGGFRDFTRIAGSSPEMWRDICVANRAALLDELERYQAQLDRMAGLIEQGDGDALERLFTRARDARARWLVPRK
ncbi:MAG TPA: prephenate dehydrogenase/arogenate dehydrogenase family protein [Burkholderiales bacterium]|nr:prephenate dehydrogenase/arogenate dehydrogenase family protein [Burkholderiales bacterium]